MRNPGPKRCHFANWCGTRSNYQPGHYGDGWIVVFDRIAGFRVAKRATVSLEAYSTQRRGDGTRNNQGLRHLLEKHNLGPVILREVNKFLASRKVKISTGTIVDATLHRSAQLDEE